MAPLTVKCPAHGGVAAEGEVKMDQGRMTWHYKMPCCDTVVVVGASRKFTPAQATFIPKQGAQDTQSF